MENFCTGERENLMDAGRSPVNGTRSAMSAGSPVIVNWRPLANFYRWARSPMLKKLAVRTRLPREYLLKYFNENTCYSNVPSRHKRRHNPHFPNVLCKFFAKDSCARGNDCIFSHDVSQFPCADHTQYGVCTRPECLYRHDSIDPEPPRDSTPARDSSEEKKPFVSPFL